jgi:hypothetical protein
MKRILSEKARVFFTQMRGIFLPWGFFAKNEAKKVRNSPTVAFYDLWHHLC